jgi:hypothetical protein
MHFADVFLIAPSYKIMASLVATRVKLRRRFCNLRGITENCRSGFTPRFIQAIAG